MTTTNTTEARARLPELLDLVAAGDEVTITRHGRPVAVLVRPDALRARRAGPAMATAERLQKILAAGRATALGDVVGLSASRADELVAELRADRDHG